jgi:hypothetical protein
MCCVPGGRCTVSPSVCHLSHPPPHRSHLLLRLPAAVARVSPVSLQAISRPKIESVLIVVYESDIHLTLRAGVFRQVYCFRLVFTGLFYDLLCRILFIYR